MKSIDKKEIDKNGIISQIKSGSSMEKSEDCKGSDEDDSDE